MWDSGVSKWQYLAHLGHRSAGWAPNWEGPHAETWSKSNWPRFHTKTYPVVPTFSIGVALFFATFTFLCFDYDDQFGKVTIERRLPRTVQCRGRRYLLFISEGNF